MNYMLPRLFVLAFIFQAMPVIADVSPQHTETNRIGKQSLALRHYIGLINFPALKRAINDLSEQHPAVYTKGRDYQAKLNQFEGEFASIKDGLASGSEESVQKAVSLVDLQRDILLGNPCLDFDDVLLIRRKVKGNLGLPANWQSNSSLAKHGWDNAIALLAVKRLGAPLKPLFKPEDGAFISDIDLHFDADRMMFSMPGANKRWQLHEMSLDGKTLKELSLIPDHDVDNYDACYLPDGNIIFTSTAPFIGVPCVKGASHVTNTYLYDHMDHHIRRLTFDQDHNWSPTVMNNGRVLYLRWEYSDIPHMASRILFAMNPDGTNQQGYYGSNSYWPNSIFYARPIPGHPTKVVGIVTGHHGVARMGELVIFDPAKGRFEADGVVQRIPGYGQTVEPIIKDRLVDDSWPKFLHPYPLSETCFLVSAKPSPKSNWGIYLVDIYDNMLLLREEPGYALFEPVPVKKQTRPPIIPSRVDEEVQHAIMHISDIYTGDGLKGVARGTVKTLRLFSYQFAYHGMGGQVNRIGLDGPWDVKRILGTVPVEEDGSAMFTVPANTPISMQPLDKEGKAIALMRSWATAMPGETLSCVGCHESQNTVPFPESRMASNKAASTITPWYGSPRGFSFTREVQPVLNRYCVGCHDGLESATGDETKPVRPNFTVREPVEVDCLQPAYKKGTRFSPAYLALRRYVRTPTIESDMHLLPPYEFHANTTELIQMLEKGHHNVTLSEEAKNRLYTWIDLHAPYHGNWVEIVGTTKVSNQQTRRIALMKKYSGREDDEETVAELCTEDVAVVMPEKTARKTDPLAGVSWGFPRQEAMARQEVLGSKKKTIKLGQGITMDLVAVPSGSYIMGDVDGYKDEYPLSRHQISNHFWMGQYEITNEQYAVYDPDHDSGLENGDFLQFSPRERGYDLSASKQPVCRVSFDQAMAFCDWLSNKTGKAVSLPTEVQWEWACRGGTQTQHNYGKNGRQFAEHANLADAKLEEIETLDWSLPSGAIPKWRPAVSSQDDRFRVSAPVGSYAPNAWGLYDMHGNVAEWTRSLYLDSPCHDHDKRTVRGGSWYSRPKRATSSYRWGYHAYQRVYDVGFRVIVGE